MNQLSAGVIMKRVNESSPEDIFGPIYLLKNQQNESYFKDVREFSTILNSCGRLNKPSIGIGALLNDENSKQKAVEVMTQYIIELIKGLNWIHDQRKLISIICKYIKAELGCHEMAAGCSFSQDQEELFINNAKDYLSSLIITQ